MTFAQRWSAECDEVGCAAVLIFTNLELSKAEMFEKLGRSGWWTSSFSPETYCTQHNPDTPVDDSRIVG